MKMHAFSNIFQNIKPSKFKLLIFYFIDDFTKNQEIKDQHPCIKF